MKTTNTLTTLALAFFFSFQLMNAQIVESHSATEIIPTGWEVSKNWLQQYRDNISPYSSLSWISDIMGEDTEMLSHSNSPGIILVQEIENEDSSNMKELAESGFHHGHTRIFASEDATHFGYVGATATLEGNLEGVPVIMQKICFPSAEEGKVITILSIVPQKEAWANKNQPVFSAGTTLAYSLGFSLINKQAHLTQK